MTRRFSPPAAVVAAFLAAAPAQAQDLSILSDLFSNVENVTLFAQLGGVFDRDGISSRSVACCLAGAGTEVLINLRTSPGGIGYELGLGTSFLRGFRSRVEGLDFRGSVRSFPTLSLYVSGQDVLGSETVLGYLGGSFGLVELWHARAFDEAGTRHPASAQTLELGASAGLYLDRGPLAGLFAEAAYRHRSFPSVDWGDDGQGVPERWPRSLDLSGTVFSFGYQFSVRGRGDSDDEEDSGLPGLWIGERMDGQAFPGLLEAGPAGQTELVGATLSLVAAEATGNLSAASGTYELVLLRKVTERSGERVSPSFPPAEPLRGEYRVENGTARLIRTSGEPHTVILDGDHLHLRLAGTSHLLTFRRAKR